ncbi:hypothetical protein BYT27DRAFT_7015826, partial [Phlegmacium glaucopus]
DADYHSYLQLRQDVMRTPLAKPAYRMGGIVWRLAMESTANFDDVIDSILDGPSQIGPTTGEYFYLDGHRYYDDCLTPAVIDMICGVFPRGESHGAPGAHSYWPTPSSW